MDYVIEVFVPAKKRRYGYYVMPILAGERFIGRADLNVNRAEKRMEIKGLWPEPDVASDDAQTAAIGAAIAELTDFTPRDPPGTAPTIAVNIIFTLSAQTART